MERGEGREKDRKRNIDPLPLTCLQLGTWLATQAGALVRNRTGDLLVCGRMPNSLSHTSQGWFITILNISPFPFPPNEESCPNFLTFSRDRLLLPPIATYLMARPACLGHHSEGRGCLPPFKPACLQRPPAQLPFPPRAFLIASLPPAPRTDLQLAYPTCMIVDSTSLTVSFPGTRLRPVFASPMGL